MIERVSQMPAEGLSAQERAIDRIAPTIRPRQVFVMWQRWSHLLFLHWPCDPDLIQPHLPPGLEVDTFGGQAYVGIVSFLITGVRPPFLPAVPWLSNFPEVNARTYVHRAGRDPGVWFFSLDAASLLAVWGARLGFCLPYFHAQMSVDVRSDGDEPRITYHSRRRGAHSAEFSARYRPLGKAAPAAPGTLDFFLVERYILYAQAKRTGQLYLGRVHHRPYPVQAAEASAVEESLLAAGGLSKPAGLAPLSHYASEVTVRVYPLERAL